MTGRGYDTAKEGNPGDTVTVDLLSGKVEGDIHGDKIKEKSEVFYEVFALKLPAGTDASSLIRAAQALNLNSKAMIRTNAALWKGAADLSAAVRAVHDAKQIVIAVSVTDDKVLPTDKVWLTDSVGKTIAAKKHERKLTDKGYEEVFYIAASTDKHGDEGGIKPDLFRRWTVHVSDSDPDKNGQSVEITNALSAHGVKKRGGLLLLQSASMPTVQNFDIEAMGGSLQDPPIDMPPSD